MIAGFRAAALVALTCAVASFVIRADAQSQSAEVQIQLGNEFLTEGRYGDALDAFKRGVAAAGPDDLRAARSGLIHSALRVAEFDMAREEAERLVAASPHSPEAIAL